MNIDSDYLTFVFNKTNICFCSLLLLVSPCYSTNHYLDKSKLVSVCLIWKSSHRKNFVHLLMFIPLGKQNDPLSISEPHTFSMLVLINSNNLIKHYLDIFSILKYWVKFCVLTEMFYNLRGIGEMRQNVAYLPTPDT